MKKIYSEWICDIDHHSPSCPLRNRGGAAVMGGLLILK